MLYIYRNNLCCNINSVKNKLLFQFEETWSKNVLLKPKLKTYMQIRENFAPETYVLACLSRNQRSLVAQQRTGILPLAIKTGQFNNILEENRLCEMCDLNGVESETHFLLHCTLYDDLRECPFMIFYNLIQICSIGRMRKSWNGCLILIFLDLQILFLKLGKEGKTGCFERYFLLHPGPGNGLFDCLVSYKPMRAGHTIVCMTQ